MDINQVGTVTVPVTDASEAVRNLEGLKTSLNSLNDSVKNLKNATVFSKALAAEGVLNDARDFMGQSFAVFCVLSSELSSINAKIEVINRDLERINNIGVIKNG